MCAEPREEADSERSVGAFWRAANLQYTTNTIQSAAANDIRRVGLTHTSAPPMRTRTTRRVRPAAAPCNLSGPTLMTSVRRAGAPS